MLLRALDGRADVEPDLTLLEACLGDRYLLCSDGLSGVVSEETLHRTLATVANLDEVVLQLVELAIRGGGPDNITCIVADVVDSAATAPPASDASVMAGAASNGSGSPHFRTDSPAGRAHLLTRTAPQAAVAIAHDDPAPQAPEEPEDEYHRRRRLPLVKSALVILVILVVGGAYAGWRYTQTQYYVASDAGQVVIYRGINQSAAGISLSSVASRSGIPVAELPAAMAADVRATIPSDHGLAGAQSIVTNLRSNYLRCHAAAQKLQQWEATPPKTVKKKVKNKTITTHVRQPKPAFPADCPVPGSTASGTGGTS
jgi:protein phosphatase